MSKRQKLQATLETLEALRAEATELADIDDPSDEQEARFSAVIAEAKDARAEADRLETEVAALDALEADRERTRAAIREGIADGTMTVSEPEPAGTFAAHVRTESPYDGDLRNLPVGETIERSNRALGEAQERGDVSAEGAEKLDRLFRKGESENFSSREVRRRMLLSERPAYRSAFHKAVKGEEALFTDEERAAVAEFRAQTSNNADGGYGIPVLIDPSIILTSGAADAPVVAISRVENITTNVWKGVSSEAVSWSNDGADAGQTPTEVSDDSVTLAQPTVTTYEQRGFIPYSLAIAEDYPGFASEMSALLQQGYVDHLAVLTITGSGTGPQGIVTALDANANVEVDVTTDGAFGAEDLRKVWAALPERYRSRATWLMHTDVANEVDSFGSNDANFTTTLAEGNVRVIKGRPTALTDYMPEFTGTTGAANILVVGDFSNYLIAQRIGMTIENVGHLFGTTNGRPISRKGWFARTRMGADSVNDLGFRLLQNT